jgi:hypothetical protein
MNRMQETMIAINVLLAFLFVVSNVFLWLTVNNYVRYGLAMEWSPLTVHPTFIGQVHSLPLNIGWDQLNIPFWLFWVIFTLNIGFIIKLRESKETHST